MEENKEVATTEQVNDVIQNVERGELTDVMLVCMIVLTFQYSIKGTGKTHLTIDELFESLDKFFIIEKSDFLKLTLALLFFVCK